MTGFLSLAGVREPETAHRSRLAAGIFASILMFALLLACPGCGYHTAGQGARLPADLHTIAIPAFQNQTVVYRVEQVLTAAVVREFLTRTHYRIVNQEDPNADAVLRGTVTAASIAPITYSSQTGLASSGLVTVVLRVALVDRKGKVLYANPSYSFHQQYEISQEPTSFFQEETPALDRLSREFARTLVSNVLEAF